METVTSDPVGESSTPKQETPVAEEQVEKKDAVEEVEDQAEDTQTDDQSKGGNASPVEEPKKPDAGDMVPRTRLNEEIFKKKKVIEESAEKDKIIADLQAKLEKRPEQAKPVVSSQAAPYPMETDADVDYDPQKLQSKRVKWHQDEVTRQLNERDQQREQQNAQKQYRQTQESFNQKLREYAEKNPSYLEDYSAAGDPSYPNHVTQALIDSDHGPAIDHHLLKDDSLRERIMAMPQHKALVEIGKIEAIVTAPKPEKKKPAPRQTRAPAPIETSSGVSSSGPDILDGYIIE